MMELTTMPSKPDAKPSDRSALMLMLAYVEAECRRMGAEAAANHAAMAAALVPDGVAGTRQAFH
jgi:hypothetical protein